MALPTAHVRVRRAALVACGSLLLHAVALLLLPQGQRLARVAETPQTFVDFEWTNSALPMSAAATVTPPAPSVLGAAEQSPAPRRAANARAARETRARPPAPAPAPRMDEAPVIAPQPAPAPELATAPQADAAPARPARPLDLSPRSAALSTVPATPAPSASTGEVDELPAARNAELSASLRAAANADADRLRHPRELELRRDPDGTCHYSGSAIEATILPDGGVQIAERAARYAPALGVDEPPAKPYTLEDTQAPQQLQAAVKMTPRAWDAERAWFMRETESLRRELADAAHARELATSSHGLIKQLDRIWCDAQRSKPQRRRALYELWADTSDDEVGAHGRAVIIDYIRRNLPEGSPDAYPRAELTALAALSPASMHFDPYAAPGAQDAGLR
jgi:hypothetical protein